MGTNDNLDLKEGGRTALHVACQRDSDYKVSADCANAHTHTLTFRAVLILQAETLKGVIVFTCSF